MKNLSVKLNQDYKSFEDGFDFSFRGDLIVISGVNGSGKSQLMDIIRQQPQDPNQKIIADIELDGNKIESSNVVFRSFKESFNLGEIPQIGVSKVSETKNQVWNYYNEGKLFNEQPDIAETYKKSLSEAKSILIKKFKEEKFRSKGISQEDIMNTDFEGFLWQPDDPFSGIVGDMFFNYVNKIKNEKLKYSQKKEIFDLEKFSEDPPWVKLNKLFEDLKLEYRFENERDAYFLKEDDSQPNKAPQIYPLLENGGIDRDNSRKLADLSDGEKAIILLIFASFNNVSYEHKKILLLDEFDATFNPSLIEAFYKVIEKYFISKGVLVMIATHSPATISLAPKHANFYEVFSKIKTKKRILPVQRNEYKEIQIANKNFYKEITDYESRIQILEDKNKEKEEINKINKPILFVEGELEKKLFEKILPSESGFSIYNAQSADKLSNQLIAKSFIEEKYKILGLFDNDDAGKSATKEYEKKKKSNNFVKKEYISPSQGLRDILQNEKISFSIDELLPNFIWEYLDDNDFLEDASKFSETKIPRNKSYEDYVSEISSSGVDKLKISKKIKRIKKNDFKEYLLGLSDSDFEEIKQCLEPTINIIKEYFKN